MRARFHPLRPGAARAALLAAALSCTACASAPESAGPAAAQDAGPAAVWRRAIADAEALLLSAPYNRPSARAAARIEDFLAGLIDSAWRASALRAHPHSLSLVKSWTAVAAPGPINPDNLHFTAALDPGRSYLLEGVRGTHTQLFLQILSEDPQLAVGVSLQVLDDRDMGLRPGEPFRIYLGGERRPGKWFPLPAKARSLLMRQTFSDWENERPTLVSLRRLEQEPPARLRAPEGRFALAARYLKRSAELWARVFPARITAQPFNRVYPPRSMSKGLNSLQGAGFRYRVTPEQALIVTARRSPAPYQAIQVGTPWFAAPDSVHHQSSLNQHQAHLDPDGSFRFIIALEDPGLQNWTDPAGEAQGVVYMRWQGLERPLTEAEYPRLDVVPKAELEDWLRRAGSTMPEVATPRPPRYSAPALK